MRKTIIMGLLVTSFLLVLLAVPRGAVPPQTGGAYCKCTPTMFLRLPESPCGCSDLTISNLVSVLGKCQQSNPQAPCQDVSVKKCSISGTVTETNCAPGVTGTTNPFNVAACCRTLAGPPPPCQNRNFFNCAGGTPGDCTQGPPADCYAVDVECGVCGEL